MGLGERFAHYLFAESSSCSVSDDYDHVPLATMDPVIANFWMYPVGHRIVSRAMLHCVCDTTKLRTSRSHKSTWACDRLTSLMTRLVSNSKRYSNPDCAHRITGTCWQLSSSSQAALCGSKQVTKTSHTPHRPLQIVELKRGEREGERLRGN